LESQNLLLQKIKFNQNDEDYINNKITAVFPWLVETGWVCYRAKGTSELEEFPFEPSAIKDLDYNKRYFNILRSKFYILILIEIILIELLQVNPRFILNPLLMIYVNHLIMLQLIMMKYLNKHLADHFENS
jgi:hypothetical protein